MFKALKSLRFGHFSKFDVLKGLKRVGINVIACCSENLSSREMLRNKVI